MVIKILHINYDDNSGGAAIAVNRIHKLTKTNQNRFLHYKEAIEIVRKYYNSVPLKWYTYALYSVLYRSLLNKYHNLS